MKTDTTQPDRHAKAIVLYDGVCNLCSGTVRFIARRDPAGYFRFAALQSDKGRELLARYDLGVDDVKTIILLEQGEAFTQSDAVLAILRRLQRGWPLLSFLRVVPRFVRNACYRFVAAHRYRWFGRKAVCEIPSEDMKARFL